MERLEEKEKVKQEQKEWQEGEGQKRRKMKDGRNGSTVHEAVFLRNVAGDSRKSEAPRKRSEFPLLIAIIILTRSLLSSQI